MVELLFLRAAASLLLNLDLLTNLGLFKGIYFIKDYLHGDFPLGLREQRNFDGTVFLSQFRFLGELSSLISGLGILMVYAHVNYFILRSVYL